MTKAKTITTEIVQNTRIQRILFRVFISALILLFCVYIYLIGSITFNILARKALENTVIVLNNQISSLEITYLDNVNKIDKNYASSIGFVDTSHNLFATRESSRVAVR